MKKHEEGEPMQIGLCAPPEIKAHELTFDAPRLSRECKSLNEFREFRTPKKGSVPARVFVRLADRWAGGVAIGASSDEDRPTETDCHIAAVTVRLDSGSVLEVTLAGGILWERPER